ncbi:MAG: TonB family protein [Bacteroidota bacterium]
MKIDFFPKLLSLFLSLIILSVLSPAQDTTFYNIDWEIVNSRQGASYYSFFEKEGKSWKYRRYYLANHQLQTLAFYEDEKRMLRTGQQISFYENGKSSSLYTYAEGKYNGPYKAWYENGNLQEEGNYRNWSPIGTWTKWFENGKKKEILEYSTEVLAQVISLWDEEGRPLVVNGNGEYIRYHKNGQIALKGEVKNKMRQGEFKSYYESGALFEKVDIKNNRLHGEHVYYFESGNPNITGTYKKNQKLGMWIHYNEAGDTIHSVNYESYPFKSRIPGFWDFGSREPEPYNIHNVKMMIGYPQIARDQGIQGTVLRRVLVSKDGTYIKHKLMNSSLKYLTEAVERHIDKLKFTPAVQDFKPIEFWVNIPFNFKLLN